MTKPMAEAKPGTDSTKPFDWEQLKLELQRLPFLQGNLGLLMGKNRKIFYRAGRMIGPNEFEAVRKKLGKGGQKVFSDLVGDPSFQSETESEWVNFQRQEKEWDAFLAGQKLMARFGRLLWEGQGGGNWLDLCLSTYRVFMRVPQPLQQELYDISEEHFLLSLQIATLAVYFGLLGGNLDFKLAQDTYQLCFFMDYQPWKENFSYHIAQALKLDRLYPGGGFQYLQKYQLATYDLTQFLNAPVNTHQKLQEGAKDIFNNPDLCDIVLRISDEDYRKDSYFNSLEAAIISAGLYVGKGLHPFESNGGRGFLKKRHQDLLKFSVIAKNKNLGRSLQLVQEQALSVPTTTPKPKEAA